MNVIIVGAGKVGNTVAGQLSREGHGVTVIDRDEEALENMLGLYDVAGYCGSCMDCDVLRQAGIEEADLFIALMGDDEQNLLSCLLARKLGAGNTIARVRRPEFNGVIPLIAEDLGLSMVVNPEKEAAMEIARVLELPLAKKVETFAQGKVEMVDYDVGADSPLCGKCIKDVFAKMRSALVCAVERKGEVFIPLGNFRFKPGDTMTVVAPTGNILEFFRESGVKRQSIKRVIVCGGGRTGFYLSRQLLSQKIDVTIIEQDSKVALSLREILPKAKVFVGDGTNQAVLEERGIDKADAFCCLTGIDEENILTALYAKNKNPNIKTITKINRVELVPIVKPLGVGSVVSPKLIASDRVIRYVRAKQNGEGSSVLTLYRIVDNKAEALEFEVGSDSRIVGVPIRELKLKENVILACINRQGVIISPRGDDMLMGGDTVIVVTTGSGFDEVDDILRG